MSERTRQQTGPVADCVRQMYNALGNPVAFDRFLHPEVTIWESDQPAGRFGLAQLSALRDHRAAGRSGPRPELSVEDLLVDSWGQAAAVARYVLRARTERDGETYRVTDVWSGVPDGWRIVHHHAEKVVQETAPLSADHAQSSSRVGEAGGATLAG